ncbi:MAG: N-acetyltransferase [Anaerolineales bacterium]|nr:N-acetyltransferase [Anaerolineales bacterium]
MPDPVVYIHPSADVSAQTTIGPGTRVWHWVQIREGVTLGNNCIVGKGVYIDFEVEIGDNVKIQNNALIYHGAKIEDGVFIGPQACLTNDRYPRAITPEGTLKGAEDWVVGPTLIRHGASIGAGAIILPDVTIGRFAMVAAGAVVTQDVPDHALAMGIPAQIAGYVCRCGRPMVKQVESYHCSECDWTYLPQEAGA